MAWPHCRLIHHGIEGGKAGRVGLIARSSSQFHRLAQLLLGPAEHGSGGSGALVLTGSEAILLGSYILFSSQVMALVEVGLDEFRVAGFIAVMEDRRTHLSSFKLRLEFQNDLRTALTQILGYVLTYGPFVMASSSSYM